MRQVFRGTVFHLLDDPDQGADAAVIHEDGALLVEDGHVVEAGTWNDIQPLVKGAPVERFPDGLIVPGFIAAEKTRAIGLIVVDLGGGRRKTSDVVDMGVGLSGFLPIGTKVAAGDTLALVHAKTDADAAKACAALAEAITIADAAPAARPLVHARVI